MRPFGITGTSFCIVTCFSGLQVRTNLDPSLVDYVICGTVIQEVKTSNVAREVCKEGCYKRVTSLRLCSPPAGPTALLRTPSPRRAFLPTRPLPPASGSSPQARQTSASLVRWIFFNVFYFLGGVESMSDVPIRFSRNIRKRLIARLTIGSSPSTCFHVVFMLAVSST